MQEHNNGILDRHKIIGQTKKLYILHLNDLYFYSSTITNLNPSHFNFECLNFQNFQNVNNTLCTTKYIIFSLYSKSHRPSQNNFLAFILFKYIYIHT